MNTKFSAKEPALGYYYQLRYALYLLLKDKDKEEHFIRLENLDDVEIGDMNKVDLYQTKFHNKKAANLSNASTDIWKTIRVWSELALNKVIDLDNALLVLVTTSQISRNSILNKLTENRRGVSLIKEVTNKLIEVTKTSDNNNLKSSFEAFNKLTSSQREKLVQNIYIKDNALGFDDLKKAIQKELRLSCLPLHIEKVYYDLEGWWYEQCMQHIMNKKQQITYAETEKYIHYLTEKLKSDNLPIDKLIRQAQVDSIEYEDRIFIEQLRFINIGEKVIHRAKRDFYRAYEQRAKWIREDLLNPEEVIEYEERLIDDWEGKFSVLEDDIESCKAKTKIKKCKKFFISFYGKTNPSIYIRPRVQDSFLVKGSYHMLSDKQSVVWHPNYIKP